MRYRYDHHMHVVSPPMMKMLKEKDLPILLGEDHSAQVILSWLDQAEFQKATILSAAYLWASPHISPPKENVEQLIREENHWTALQQALCPERLRGLMSFSPLDTEAALREMARCDEKEGLKGIKLHFDANGVDLMNPEHLRRVRPVFQEAARRQLPVLLHYGIKDDPEEPGGISPEALDLFLEEIFFKAPGLKMQFAHGIGLFSRDTEASFRRLITRRREHREIAYNVWIDISAALVDQATAEYYEGLLSATPEEEFRRIAERLREFGMERVLFGSDFDASPTLNPRDYSRFVRENLPLSPEEMERLFTNPGPFWE